MSILFKNVCDLPIICVINSVCSILHSDGADSDSLIVYTFTQLLPAPGNKQPLGPGVGLIFGFIIFFGLYG